MHPIPGWIDLKMKVARPVLAVCTAAPTITGTAAVGSVLTRGAGVWTLTPTVTWAWLRNGIQIKVEAGATYTQVALDAGKRITLRERASITAGVQYASSLPVNTIPQSTTAPVIAGTATVGSTLKITAKGVWVGANTVTWVWQRTGVTITGTANLPAYTLVPADAADTITVLETATGLNLATNTRASNGIVVP